jgi:Fusaric acid resistance protein-like
VSRESWQSRLLGGLSGLGGWLVGPDPGLNRLRTVLCATLTIAGAIGAEWLFVRFTGALQRSAPPAAAGAAAAAQVAAANRAVVIFAMVLGGVTGLIAAISVNDTSPRDQVVSMLFLLLPMIAVLDLLLAVGGDRVLALCLLPVILAAVTYLRRFGPRGVRAASVVFAGYLKAFSRIAGTLVGIVVGSALVNLIGMHAAWTIVVILASVLLGLYLQRADYAFLVIGITVMVSQLYAEFGDFSSSLLVERLEETSLFQDAYGVLGGAENAALLQGDTWALNAAYRALASTIESMGRLQAGGQSQRAGAAMTAARASRHYALNLLRDITPAAAPDADTAALLDRGCATQQASLTALQSAGAGSPRGSYTRSASLFDRAEHRLTGAGGNDAEGHLVFRDLRLIDGALAQLAGALGMGITSYDIGRERLSGPRR